MAVKRKKIPRFELGPLEHVTTELTFRVFQVQEHGRGEVAALVLERVEVVGHTLVRVVGDLAQVLDVSRVLALAGEPDDPAHHGSFGAG